MRLNLPLWIFFPLSFLPILGDVGRIYRYEIYMRISLLLLSVLGGILLSPDPDRAAGYWLLVSDFCPLCRGLQKRWRTFKVNNKKQTVAKYQGENCTFCWSDWKRGEMIAVLECEHAFHEECLLGWVNRQKQVCPICSREF